MPTAQVNGATLYYERAGVGDPLVFLHGAWGGLRNFDAQFDGLTDDFEVIAVDFRGHGRSEKTEAGHTIAQYARDVEAILDLLDIEKTVLVGWSLGAIISWEYVHRFGTDHIRGLVDVDMEAAPGDWSPDSPGRYDADTLQAITDAVQADHWALIEQSNRDLVAEPQPEPIATTMFDEFTRCPPTIKVAIIAAATTCDYRDVLRGLDVPILVCAGADETWRSVAAVEEIDELAPDSQFVLFEESGHCPMFEEPDRFNRIVSEFVESL